jgi:hypothetical protein
MNPEQKTLGELIQSDDEIIHRNAWSIYKQILKLIRETRIVKSPDKVNK